MFKFPQRLKAWRIHRRMTQLQLAEKSGIPRPNLVAIEQGRRDCTLRTLSRMAQALDLSPGSLLEEWPVSQSLDRRQIDEIARSLIDSDLPLSADLSEIREGVAWQAIPLLRAAGLPSSHLRGGKRRKTLAKEVEAQILDKFTRLLPLNMRTDAS
jgi:transcriptional regulator with XRE-family HTH domain